MLVIKKTKEDMYGIFTTKSIKSGETIHKFSPDFINSPTQTSIQCKKKHFEDRIGKYLNHHCNPNAKIITNKQSIILTSLEKIEENKEITFNYNTTEEKITYPFKCKCHNKLIKGKKYAIKYI
tara:strand:- start:107 stop:475 length:369 start_codon:yes stop_codon:yes gene_type:complete